MTRNDASVPLIRTGFRDKLPRGLSYPIGAELISQRSVAACGYDELWISFGSKPGPVYAAPAECVEFHRAFSVVCSDRSGARYLSVPAVPSTERAVARQLLVMFGLPSVRDWLCLLRPETWYEGFRAFQVGYTIEPQRMCFIESHNYRVLDFSIIAPDGDCAKPPHTRR